MFRTITVGSCVSIQGILVRNMADGNIVVQVGDKLFVGKPASAK